MLLMIIHRMMSEHVSFRQSIDIESLAENLSDG